MNKDNEQREIKFRAWNIELEKFFYSDYNDEVNDGREYYPFCFWIGFKGDHHPKMILQQFTGLLDKNGKEIYEGDILKLKFGQVESIYEVIWDNYHAGWNLIHWKREGDEFGIYTRNISLKEPKEIIGHIFESSTIRVKQ